MSVFLCGSTCVQDISISFHFLITDEGVYVDTNGKLTKNVILQWGELPTSLGKNDRSLSISLLL